jgi:hypothetical protein
MKRIATVLACCVLWVLMACHKDKPTVIETPRIIWTAGDGFIIEARYSDGSSLFFRRMTDSLHENDLTCIGNRFLDEEEYEGDGFSVVIPSTIIAKISLSDYYGHYDTSTFVVSGIGNQNNKPWGFSEGNTVFDNRITSLTLPNTINYIGDRCFSDCSSLAEVVFPEGLEVIGVNAFESCSSLSDISFPGTIRKVGDGAFKGCSSLRSVTILPGKDTIADDAFRGAFQKAYGFDDAYVSLVLPDGLKFIGRRAFSYCNSLASLTLPEELVFIGRNAFTACGSLTSCVCKAVEPPILDHSYLYSYSDYPFDDSSIQAIFVPRESVEAYQNADGWNHYASIIFPIE